MKAKYILIAVILICLTNLFNCSINADRSPDQTHTIAKGVVSDTTLGKPIDSVEIVLTKSVYVSLFDAGVDYYIGPKYTNSNGEFFIENKHNYNDDDIVIYKLSVGKQGYWYQFFDIEENEVNEFNIALRLHPTELHTSVISTVVDKVTRQPIDLVNVYFLRKDDFTPPEWDTVGVTLTDSQGKFFVEDYYTRQKTENYPRYQLDFKKAGYNNKTSTWDEIGTNMHNEWDAIHLIPE